MITWLTENNVQFSQQATKGELFNLRTLTGNKTYVVDKMIAEDAHEVM